MTCSFPSPLFPSPFDIGLQEVLPLRDGYSVYLDWRTAVPDVHSYTVGYNIYYSTDQENVFLEGPKHFTLNKNTTIIGFVPGDTIYFAVRATEFDPSYLNLLGMPNSPHAENAYNYPETALSEDIDNETSRIPLIDVSEFPSIGILKVGYELIQYSNIDYLDNIIYGIRGYYDSAVNSHTIDGYDGYDYYDPTVRLFAGFEDLNQKIVLAQPRIEYPEFPFTELDGYKQTITDILTTDLSSSDDSAASLTEYDYTGYHSTSIVNYFSGNCIGSYAGGEYGCADGYKVRGLNIQAANNQRQEMLLNVTGEPVVLMKRLWTGIKCNCYRLNQEHHEGRCHVCFTPETLIRTSTGYKKIYKININDMVLSSDGYFHKVINTFCNNYDGYIKSILSSVNSNRIKVTPEHPILTLGGSHIVKNGCGPMCDLFIKNGDGNNGNLDVRQLPSCRWHARVQVNGTRGVGRKALGTFNKKEDAIQSIIDYKKENILPGHILQWKEAKNLHNNSWLVTKYPNYINDIDYIYIPKEYLKNTKLGLIRNGVDKFEITEEFMWIIGIYLAEGSCGKRRINFSLHKNEILYQNRIKTFFENFGYNSKIKTTSNNGVNVCIYSTTLANWFPKLVGRKCYNKYIPEEFMYLPNNKIKSLISGVNDGDGSKTGSEYQITQTSKILALQLVELLNRLNEQPILRSYQIKTLTPKGNVRKRTYSVNWTKNLDKIDKNRKKRWDYKNESLAKIRDIEDEYYCGPVYNLEVEGDHTYIVNGIVVHNCFSTSFIGGYEQFYNDKRSDGRILVRFDATIDDLAAKQIGLEQNFVPNCWTTVYPAIKDRDVLIRFNQDGTEEFRYEVVNVTRNKLLFSLSGAQKFNMYRLDKTDPIYQWRAFRNTSSFPYKINTSLSILRAHGPHMHAIVLNEKTLSLNDINQTTSVMAGHNHPIINGVIQEVLGHTHDIII